MDSRFVAPPVVKICGVQDPLAAEVAARAGASVIGVIMAPSRRHVEPEAVRGIRDYLRDLDLNVPVVCVVVNETAESLNDRIERSGIDMVQLSGDETPDLFDDVPVRVIKAIRVRPEQSRDDVEREIDKWLDRPRPVEAILLDAYVEGHFGGTGLRADWVLAAELAERYPLMLAGGLTPENVGEGVLQVRPFGVDASSGVETSGVKDHAKIEAFISAFRDAIAALNTTQK